jgi:hypothetical protein
MKGSGMEEGRQAINCEANKSKAWLSFKVNFLLSTLFIFAVAGGLTLMLNPRSAPGTFRFELLIISWIWALLAWIAVTMVIYGGYRRSIQFTANQPNPWNLWLVLGISILIVLLVASFILMLWFSTMGFS